MPRLSSSSSACRPSSTTCMPNVVWRLASTVRGCVCQHLLNTDSTLTVLIEKPITVRAEDGKALIELAQQKELVLYTFQNRRWDADFLAVQEVLKSGKLGQLNDFTSHYDRFKPLAALPDPTVWKEQPGHANDSIYNLGAHLIDQALLLFGRPKEVLGISWPIRGLQGLDDSASIRSADR